MWTLLRNKKFRNICFQALALSGVTAVIVYMVITARHSFAEQGMTSGFGFLDRSTGWDFSFSLIDYSISDTYRRVVLIGILNTLFLGAISIACASIAGILVGLARISHNYLLRGLGTIYVEIFRNIPLILQAVFWYAIVSHLPRPKQAYAFADSVFLSGRGLYFPSLNIESWAVWWMLAVPVAGILIIALLRAQTRISVVKRRISYAGWAIIIATIVAIAVISRIPDTPLINYPVLKGLNYKGGTRMPPELWALIIAITLYGGAYIGEVVRAGLISVPRGQIEAGRVMGLSSVHIFTRIRLPLAIRAVLPALTNQYVMLMKATTIGIVVAFADFFMIISTSINQSGQTLELLGILMGGFLLINLSIGTVMNIINSRIALKGYEVKS